MSKELVKANTQVVPFVSGGVPAAISDLDSYAGAGLEGTDASSYAVPRLIVVNDKAKVLDRDSILFIPGAKAGDIVNTVTKEILGNETDGVNFVPVYIEHSFVEWEMENGRGKFPVAKYSPSSAIVKATPYKKKTQTEKGGRFLENGNQLQETVTYYGLVVNEKTGISRVVITMSSTQLSVSKAWLGLINSLKLPYPPDHEKRGQEYRAPVFAHGYALTSQFVRKTEGAFFGWNVKLLGRVGHPAIVDEARSFYSEAVKGTVKVSEDVDTGVAEEETPF